MPNVRIIVATEVDDLDLTVETAEIRSPDGSVRRGLQPALAEAVARACRAHEIEPPTWT